MVAAVALWISAVEGAGLATRGFLTPLTETFAKLTATLKEFFLIRPQKFLRGVAVGTADKPGFLAPFLRFITTLGQGFGYGLGAGFGGKAFAPHGTDIKIEVHAINLHGTPEEQAQQLLDSIAHKLPGAPWATSGSQPAHPAMPFAYGTSH